MKKLQVPLDDDLMLLLKTYTFRNNITIKDFVTDLIDKGIRTAPTLAPKEEPQPKINQKSIDLPQKPDNIVVEEPKPEPPKEKLVLKPGQLIGTLSDSPLHKIPYDPDKHVIIRKTHKKKKEMGNPTFQFHGVEWYVQSGWEIHLDKDGNIIPFTFTGWDDFEGRPSEDEIQEVEKNTGKRVMFEC